MIRTAEAQSALKKAHLARLKMKGKPGYSKMYAAQPGEVRKAAEQRAERAAERAEKNAASIQAHKDADGAVAVFAQDLSTVEETE